MDCYDDHPHQHCSKCGLHLWLCWCEPLRKDQAWRGPEPRESLCPGSFGHNGPPPPGAPGIKSVANELIRWLRMLFEPRYWQRFPVTNPLRMTNGKIRSPSLKISRWNGAA